MNGNDMMKALNGLDEGFVAEAAETRINAKRRGLSRRSVSIAVGIAAAVTFALPAGAYAYERFIHRENVEHYIAGAEIIEQQSPDAVVNHVMENKNYRLTVDMQLSDGHNVIMVLTHDAKSIKGLRIKDWASPAPETYLTYADDTPGPFVHTDWAGDVPMVWNFCGFSGYAYDDKNNPFGFDRTLSIFSCDNIDLGKDIKIEYFSDSKDKHSAQLYYWQRDYPELLERYAPDFDLDTKIKNELDGIEFTTSFAPNVKCATLYSADGTEIYLSAFEVYSETGRLFAAEGESIDTQSIFFITNDGKREALKDDKWKTGIHSGDDCDYVIYGRFIDPDEYMGIEINGVEYMR